MVAYCITQLNIRIPILVFQSVSKFKSAPSKQSTLPFIGSGQSSPTNPHSGTSGGGLE